MKIYLVCWTSEATESGPFYVDKIFKTEKAAEEYIEQAEKNMYPTGANFPGIYGEPWIEEFEVED